ncbi:hypothetical protein [Coprobacter tertius]|uniref:Uncharacterized protein n=1 Tax=Coprobacter tertius TaxID=2944915 RepID=A0ABT1MIQ8_9BACT|nr:hypothetical protein [Coprobacter tertius]MCP9611949.1 hypothetical protein [Coprobacter tertius]
MGKDLHYSIRPFIENALKGHNKVYSIQPIDLDDFYAYKIIRTFGLSDMIVVLSDDYYFSSSSLHAKPEILKEGGFFLIAKPEANDYFASFPDEKLIVGKLGILLGAINKEEFWKYTIPPKRESK